MKWCARIYQFCGLNFINESILGDRKKASLKLALLLHIAYICINLSCQYEYHKMMFDYPDMLGDLTVLFEMTLPLTLHAIIVGESFVKVNKHRKIKQLMKEIRLQLSMQRNWKHSPAAQFAFLFALNTLIYVSVFILVRGTPCEYFAAADCITFLNIYLNSHTCTHSLAASYQLRTTIDDFGKCI